MEQRIQIVGFLSFMAIKIIIEYGEIPCSFYFVRKRCMDDGMIENTEQSRIIGFRQIKWFFIAFCE